jgi:predicted metallopeptidase
MDFFLAPEIKTDLKRIIISLGFKHITADSLICFRSYGSKSRAIARIWSLPKIWQIGLSLKPHYCIEVVSERFDKLSIEDKDRVLIHELLHIPQNFSGALLPHKQRTRRIDRRTVEKLFAQLMNNR